MLGWVGSTWVGLGWVGSDWVGLDRARSVWVGWGRPGCSRFFYPSLHLFATPAHPRRVVEACAEFASRDARLERNHVCGLAGPMPPAREAPPGRVPSRAVLSHTPSSVPCSVPTVLFRIPVCISSMCLQPCVAQNLSFSIRLPSLPVRYPVLMDDNARNHGEDCPRGEACESIELPKVSDAFAIATLKEL